MHTVTESNRHQTAETAASEAFAHWKKTVEAELKGAPFEKKLLTRTFEGIALQPLYTQADLGGVPDLAAKPGQAPYLRGSRPEGYRDHAWRVAQEIAVTDPAEFNTALTADLMAGQDSVVLTPKVGSPAIRNRKDLEAALAKVDLTAVPVTLHAGANAVPYAALYLSVARQRGIAWQKLTGGVLADPLATWAVCSELPHPIKELYDALAGWTSWAADHAPGLHTIAVDARLWGDAGATAVQELAFALAGGVEYLAALNTRGVPVDHAVPRFAFQFAIGPQFFTEVAKLRAWRALWTRAVVTWGAEASLATTSTVHAATCCWNKTRLDPHVNMLRATTEALSAVLGGCDSLHIAPYDSPSGATTDFSRRIARNVHTLLAEEFGFTQTADPAGGSWYVEKLTDELARKAWELFQTIQKQGGFKAALESGSLQKQVGAAAAEKSDAVGKRRVGLVGTNLFPNLKENPLPEPLPTPPRAAIAPGPQRLTDCTPDIRTWKGQFEFALASAGGGATIEQLTAAFPRSGTGHAVVAVTPWRAAAGFERLRDASEAFAKRTGKRPQVFLAKIGTALQHKVRADFSAGFFAPAGFEILGKQTFDTATAAAEAAAACGAPIAVLCSTDETYPELVPAFAGVAKSRRADLKVVLAGLPADPATIAAFRAAGVDEFIHIRANAEALLGNFLKQIGAIA